MSHNRDRHPQPLPPAERQVTGHNKAVRRPDSERLRADGKKNVTSEGKAGVPGAGCGARETGARGSRVSQHSAHACGSAIGRAILMARAASAGCGDYLPEGSMERSVKH